MSGDIRKKNQINKTFNDYTKIEERKKGERERESGKKENNKIHSQLSLNYLERFRVEIISITCYNILLNLNFIPLIKLTFVLNHITQFNTFTLFSCIGIHKQTQAKLTPKFISVIHSISKVQTEIS